VYCVNIEANTLIINALNLLTQTSFVINKSYKKQL